MGRADLDADLLYKMRIYPGGSKISRDFCQWERNGDVWLSLLLAFFTPADTSKQEDLTMKMKTKQVVLMGMFGALAAVLMLFEVPLPFIAPSFYGLDISEVPVLVGTFAMGPVAGAVMEGVKILVKLLLKPTSTGFVGEFANIVIGCSMVVPAGMIYRLRKTKKGAIEAMAVGTILMATVGAMINAL